MQPLTWDELAKMYDQYNGGRAARTLPMKKIVAWVRQRADLFTIAENGEIYRNTVAKETATI